MKIAGFTLEKKHFIIGGIIALILLMSFASSSMKQKKEEEEMKAEAARKQAELEAKANAMNNINTTEVDVDAEIQKQLVKQFGDAPEGFEWDMTGKLIALSDDASTPEDVMYYYVRSLSVLDFSTAQRYSSKSQTINAYQSYYSEIKDSITNYYTDFLRKQFKFSLTSIEIDSVQDTAVFADGQEYITLKLSVLDLQDKDFWRKDQDEIFQTMRVYDETETDSTKANQYLYDYIYSKYEDGTVGKKEHTVEIVVSKKENGSGWLVSSDGELASLLQYTNGVDVAEYILKEYSSWLMDTQLKETQIELQNQIDEINKQVQESQDKLNKEQGNSSSNSGGSYTVE